MERHSLAISLLLKRFLEYEDNTHTMEVADSPGLASLKVERRATFQESSFETASRLRVVAQTINRPSDAAINTR